MKKIVPHIITLALLLFFINTPLLSNETTNKTNYKIDNIKVTVACVKNTGYIKKSSHTTYSGYLVDYLNKLGEYYNIHFQYILTDTQEESLALVKQGIADISCLQYKTTEIEKDFSFTNLQLSALQTNLYTLSSNDNLYFDDFSNFNNITVGVRKDLNTIEELKNYTKKGNFSFNYKYYKTEKDLRDALTNKEVDAIATDYAITNEISVKIIGNIAFKPSFLITQKNSPLIEELNNSIDWLHVNTTNFASSLQAKYFQDISAYTEFTREEINYIQNQGKLKVGLLPDSFIQSHLNKETGEFEGIIIDYMKELEKLSNLDFEFVQIPLGLTVQDALNQGLCDISPYIGRNQATLNDDNIAASINYINMRELIAIRKEDPFRIDEIKSISCPANYQALLNYIANEYPTWKIVKTNANNILDPLLAGVVDVAIGNEYEIRYLMQKPKYSSLILTENYLVDILFSIGIQSSNNPLLLSIINKSIGNINNKTLEYFKLKGFLTNYKYSFFDSYLTNSLFF